MSAQVVAVRVQANQSATEEEKGSGLNGMKLGRMSFGGLAFWWTSAGRFHQGVVFRSALSDAWFRSSGTMRHEVDVGSGFSRL